MKPSSKLLGVGAAATACGLLAHAYPASVAKADGPRQVKVLVIRGAGDHFGSGA